ncbi:MAG: TetR/AcrR family transcriptional regulator [Kofleriaceae bacterium]
MRKRGQIRSNDPAAMKAKILDVAARAFHRRGYHATSMHDILAETGTSGGATYHHFPSKKALGLAVIRERVAAAVDETWLAPLRTAESTAAAIAAIFGDLTAEIDERGSVTGCPLNNLALELAGADVEFRAEVDRVFDDWRRVLADRLRADQLVLADPDAFATFVVAAYSGAMTLAKTSQTSTPLRICGAQLCAAVAAMTPRA